MRWSSSHEVLTADRGFEEAAAWGPDQSDAFRSNAAAGASGVAPPRSGPGVTVGQAEAPVTLSVVMPCLNEARTLGTCIAKAKEALRLCDISGEVVVADNGSDDGSQAIAEASGARVVAIAARGYGNALLGGIAAARGRFVIVGDSGDSYNFGDIPKFLGKLDEGFDLVMGNRFLGGIMPGAMPPLHRLIGNPVLSGLGWLFFKSNCGDFHCGLRGFKGRGITINAAGTYASKPSPNPLCKCMGARGLFPFGALLNR